MYIKRYPQGLYKWKTQTMQQALYDISDIHVLERLFYIRILSFYMKYVDLLTYIYLIRNQNHFTIFNNLNCTEHICFYLI